MPGVVRSSSSLRRTSATWTRNSSSNTSRRRARYTSSISSGRWMSCIAVSRATKPCSVRSSGGIGSAMPRASDRRRASAIHSR